MPDPADTIEAMPPDVDPDPLPILTLEAARLSVDLDERALRRFERYLGLLDEWNARAGLTTVTEPGEVQHRHFGESLALLRVLRDVGLATPHATFVDIGAGGGFPGLPLLIAQPSLAVALLEATERKCRFLEVALVELGLSEEGSVINARAEEAGRNPALREGFDVAVARAVAPLDVLVEYALPLLRPGGVLVAPKGSRALEELDEAAGAVRALGGNALTPVALPLPDDAPPQTVLLVRRTGALDDRYPRRPGIPAKRPLR